MMEWREFAERAVRVPFVEHGRSWQGWDCWGLVCVGYQEVEGVDLPSWHERYQSVRRPGALAPLIAAGLADLVEPCGADVGAIALVYRAGRAVHCGVVLHNNMVLHTEHGSGTVQEPASDLRIEGFYVPR